VRSPAFASGAGPAMGMDGQPRGTQGGSGRSGAEAEGHSRGAFTPRVRGARGCSPRQSGPAGDDTAGWMPTSCGRWRARLAGLGAGKNHGCTIRKEAASGRGLVWSLRSPPRHSSLLACAEPPGMRWVRCQPRSPTSCCWPWMRPRPTPSCTARAVATRSRWPSGFRTPGSRRPCLTTAQPGHPDSCRPPTGPAAGVGGCGCCAAWWMRSAWSVSRVAGG